MLHPCEILHDSLVFIRIFATIFWVTLFKKKPTPIYRLYAKKAIESVYIFFS